MAISRCISWISIIAGFRAKVGAEGDVAIFDMLDGEHRFVDAYGGERVGRQRLAPWRTIKGGRTYLPQW